MSKVLLLNPPGNSSYIRDNYCSYSAKANYFWEPIDLLVQSARLNNGFELFVLDAIAEPATPQGVVAKAKALGVDAIFSLTGSVSVDEDRELFRQLKQETGATIAVSGDMCLSHPERVLARMPEVDAVVSDYTTPGLAQYLANGNTGGSESYESLVYRNGDAIIQNAPATSDTELDYSAPRHDLFPIERYRITTSVNRRFVTAISSLGCNFNCPFCICSVMKLRLRSLDSLLEELHQVRRMGIREIYFYDPHFTVSKRRCIQMLERIISEDLDIVFSCNSHITVSEEVLELLAKAGCHTIMFGIENANENLLKQYSKGITRQRIQTTLKRCEKRGIRTFGYFLIGLPGETESTIRDTIKFSTQLPLHYASFNLPSPVEGTELYREVKEMGLLKTEERNQDRSSEVSIPLPGLSDEKLLYLKRLAYRRFYLRPRFLLRTLRVLYPRKKWGYFLKDVWTFLIRNFV